MATYKEERDRMLKKLNELNEQAKTNSFGSKDLQHLIVIVSKVTLMSYENVVQREKSDESHDRIMDEMDWHDFN